MPGDCHSQVERQVAGVGVSLMPKSPPACYLAERAPTSLQASFTAGVKTESLLSTLASKEIQIAETVGLWPGPFLVRMGFLEGSWPYDGRETCEQPPAFPERIVVDYWPIKFGLNKSKELHRCR